MEIKEGKTSVKKMVEDYEDERTKMHEKLGVLKTDDGILPTKNSGVIKRNIIPKEDDDHIEELR